MLSPALLFGNYVIRVTGTETVLLVEDDPLGRGLSSRVLRQRGYDVLEAGDGAEALQVAQGQTREIHLMLTDVVMPNMGVKELTDQLKALHPHLKVLFTSGTPTKPLSIMECWSQASNLSRSLSRRQLC